MYGTIPSLSLSPGSLEGRGDREAEFGFWDCGDVESGLQAVVAAWQSGAISRDTMFELFRSGEILPDGRTNQDEAALIQNAEGKHRTSNIEH